MLLGSKINSYMKTQQELMKNLESNDKHKRR